MCVQDIRIANNTDKVRLTGAFGENATWEFPARGNRVAIVASFTGLTISNGAGAINDGALVIQSDLISIGMINASKPCLYITHKEVGVLLYGRISVLLFNPDDLVIGWDVCDIFLTDSLAEIEKAKGG